MDFARDINWDQEFEIDENKQNNDHSLSSHPSNTTDAEDDDDDEYKRVRRPSDAELLKRVIQQQTPLNTNSASASASPSKNIEDNHNNTNELTTSIDINENVGIIINEMDNNNNNEMKSDEMNNIAANDDETQATDQVISPEELRHMKDMKDRNELYVSEKNIFIVTWGGRPLYSRYGSMNAKHMTSLMGVVSLFPSNVERVNVLTCDEIRSFITGDTKFIYLICGPLYFLCVTKTDETIFQIRNQLRYLHTFIVCTLTSVYERTLTESPQFDMRSIFGPTDYMLLNKLVSDCDSSPTFLFNAYYPLQLMRSTRDDIGNIIKSIKRSSTAHSELNKKLLYSFLFVNGCVVQCTQPKKRPLHSEDIILIGHIVKYHESWKHSEAFTPICLPHFEPSGFVYCYVSYLGGDTTTCLVLTSLDAMSFKSCQSLRKQIEQSFLQSNILQSIKISHDMHLKFECSDALERSHDLESPQIFAFYYHDIKKKQYIFPRPISLYSTPPGRLALFRRLQHLYDRVHSSPSHAMYFERSCHSNSDAAICKYDQNAQYECYIILNSFVSKKDAQNVLNKILNYVQQRSANFFFNCVNW